MIRLVEDENLDNMKVDVHLKDGRRFLNCDIPNNRNDNVAAFWYENRVFMIPWDLIIEVIFNFEPEE
jgi:hypothetical protein